MSSDVIISVENFSKKYRLGEIGVDSLREAAERVWHRLRGRDPEVEMGIVGAERRAQSAEGKEQGEGAERRAQSAEQKGRDVDCGLLDVGGESDDPQSTVNSPQSTDFWALRDVSFEVKRGEVLGIIGRNGAGKSTLLKILSRITEPTGGRAVMRGRVGSLLEVGTGFHPELTGRENVFLNGAILGMRKKEIEKKFDEIVAFAEVEKFIDTPVKRYSSGMYVRLAFAVAAHLDPEILLIDEVLAVGDAAFQKKCLGKMGEVAQAGRTILFVSHNMAAVSALCGRGILIQAGKIVSCGPTGQVVDEYLGALGVMAGTPIHLRKDRGGNGAGKITSFSIKNPTREKVLRSGDCIHFTIGYELAGSGSQIVFRIGVYDQFNNRIFFLDSGDAGWTPGVLSGKGEICCDTGPVMVTPGPCYVNLAMVVGGDLADHVQRAWRFDLEASNHAGTWKSQSRQMGLCLIEQTWSAGTGNG